MALKRGRVTIEPYTAVWADEFEREHALIQPIFGQYEVYHTGSTSIPGLPSKPIIDMLVGLPSLTDFEKFRAKLEAVGYISMPEREKDWEMFIPKGPDDARTHYLHALVKDSEPYRNILAFRDYLRTHDDAPDAARSVAQVARVRS